MTLTAAVILAPAASAEESFDASLASPPGVYWGTGNANAGFTVLDTTNSDGSVLELGLSAIDRFVGPITPSGDEYFVSPTSGPDALWDFVFSVNTNATGLITGDTLGDYTYALTITNETTSASESFDPTLLPDNAQYGAAACLNEHDGCAYNSANSGMQNAENLGFSFLATNIGFDPSAPDTYQITLSATSVNGSSNTDPSVTILVSTAPEPAAVFLLGTVLLAVIFVNKRLRRC